MHAKGPQSWFSAGHEERLTILQSGWPWAGLDVLEIGCGEGDLCAMMKISGAEPVQGIDYSSEAIEKANQKYFDSRFINLFCSDYKSIEMDFDRIVLQGLLEHLDDPFKELKWMIDNLLKEHGDIITSSPNFINPRGIVWMTLALLFNVPMSATDLHFLHPGEFQVFAEQNDYKLTVYSCDISWGWGKDMIKDFKKRLYEALGDAKMNTTGVPKLLKWLEGNIDLMLPVNEIQGATLIYRIET
jgi:SAM-dependent methyltransferase